MFQKFYQEIKWQAHHFFAKTRFHCNDVSFGSIVLEPTGMSLTHFLENQIALDEFKGIFIAVRRIIEEYQDLQGEIVPFHSDYFWISKINILIICC